MALFGNAQRHPEGGRTIIMGDTTPQLPVLPDKPEPPRREPVWLTKPDVCTRLRWTEQQYAAAQGLPEPCKFPIAAQRLHKAGWGWDLVWRDEQIETWLERVRAHVALLQTLIR
jgi:hypothetical protein